MTSGVCFYADFAKYQLLACVAMHSLAKSYPGPIHLILGSNVDDWFREELDRERRVTYSMAKRPRDDSHGARRGAWFRKPYLHQESPFEYTLFYDVDHVFTDDVAGVDWGEPFRCILEYGLVSFHSVMPSKRRKVMAMRAVFNDFGYSVHQPASGACVGSTRSGDKLRWWIRNMEAILESDVAAPKVVADEYSLAYTIGTTGGCVCDVKWSADITSFCAINRGAVGLHFYRGLYKNNPRWRAAYDEAVESSFCGINAFPKQHVKKWTGF